MKLSLLWRPPRKLNKHDHPQLARWLKSYILSPGTILGSHSSIILLTLIERSKFWNNSNHVKPPFFATNNHSISKASTQIKSLSRRSKLHGASWNLFTPINGTWVTFPRPADWWDGYSHQYFRKFWGSVSRAKARRLYQLGVYITKNDQVPEDAAEIMEKMMDLLKHFP